jgi:exosome complex RNA-binding protein Rrp4
MENLPEKPIKNSSPVFNFLEQDKDIVISFLTRYARKDEVFNEINFDNMKYFYCEKTGDKYITIGSIGDVNNKSYRVIALAFSLIMLSFLEFQLSSSELKTTIIFLVILNMLFIFLF